MTDQPSTSVKILNLHQKISKLEAQRLELMDQFAEAQIQLSQKDAEIDQLNSLLKTVNKNAEIHKTRSKQRLPTHNNPTLPSDSKITPKRKLRTHKSSTNHIFKFNSVDKTNESGIQIQKFKPPRLKLPQKEDISLQPERVSKRRTRSTSRNKNLSYSKQPSNDTTNLTERHHRPQPKKPQLSKTVKLNPSTDRKRRLSPHQCNQVDKFISKMRKLFNNAQQDAPNLSYNQIYRCVKRLMKEYLLLRKEAKHPTNEIMVRILRATNMHDLDDLPTYISQCIREKERQQRVINKLREVLGHSDRNATLSELEEELDSRLEV